ncbi:MAG: hypothetical protein M0Q91_17605 [Methanoregula sp.]|nr:hypothetical protein [Methanoregula sp.]
MRRTTNFALTVYRRETRPALERALGRKVTNKEQSDFILRLISEVNGWIQEQAKKEASRIRVAERTRTQQVADTTPSDR